MGKLIYLGGMLLYRVFVALVFLLTFSWGLDQAYAKVKVTDSVSESDTVTVDRTDFPKLILTTPNIQGEAVWLLQARLKELGYDLKTTGIYDYDTFITVKLFQVAHNLADTGVVNEGVWQVIMSNELGEPCLTEDSRLLGGKVVIEIETTRLLLTVYQDDEEVAKYPVALGKSSTPSPLGEWKVVHKSLNWGGGFGSRWLGLNVPWGIYGIHGTNKPGSIGTYASHGCIRMFNRDVEKLYPTIPYGATVKIVENGKMFPTNIKPTILKIGSSGQQVVYIQSRLKELGYVFDRADGRFGPMTELAVKYYQAWQLMKPTGIVDESTYRSLGMIP